MVQAKGRSDMLRGLAITVSLDDWRKNKEADRVATLEAIKAMGLALLRGFLTGEGPTDLRIADDLRQIGEDIEKHGITDAMIQEVIAEVRHELGIQLEDREAIAELFSRAILVLGTTEHETDSSPEVLALRGKHASKMAGGHAFSLKRTG